MKENWNLIFLIDYFTHKTSVVNVSVIIAR